VPDAASRLPAWLVVCFLASGAAGLLYEIVWGKQLAYLLGGSLQSVATVVAAFLGGLALGARLLGAPLARRPRLTRSYAALELGIALLGVALLPLLRSLDGPVGQLYRAFGGEGWPFACARVALLLALLVPPAALMGATLPVLVARCERGALGAGLARLYAINTLGAVAGSVLGGFLLLPSLGLLATTFVAAALNLVAATLAWTNSAGEREASSPRAFDGDEQVAAILARGPRAVFAALFALSGFTALLLQLAWVRLFALVLGSSVYSFSAVLGIYLLGLGLGSAAIGPLFGRRVVAPWWFALIQLGIALSAAAGIHAYAGLPRAMLELGERAGPSWGGLLVGELALVAPILLVPCLLLGAAFPLATRLLQHGAAGPTTGAAYAVNTLGTIIGSLATGFLLLPALGVQGVVLLAAALSAFAGLLALVLPCTARPRAVPLAAAGVLGATVAIAGLTAPRWDPLLMSLGTYRPSHAQFLLKSYERSGATGDPTRATTATQHVLFYRDGINASVLVATDLDRTKMWMRVGGKVDASTGDMLTQVLLGLIPAAIADSGARTLIVGHGSGATAAAALAAGAGPTDIVELEPAVVAGSRLFHEPAEDPLNDPRVTLHLEDARTRLAHGGGNYGLVISEPSNPWIAGVNNLFTVDFYKRVRLRLRSDGVFCQWVQLYEISPRTFQSLLASFLTVFPDAHLFCVWGSADALLVAAPPGRSISLARLESPRLKFQLERARLSTPEQIAAFYIVSGAALRELAAGGELDTDDRPFVEYQAPRDMIEVGREYAGHHPWIGSRLALPVVPPQGNPLEGWPRDQVLAWRARQRLSNADPSETEAVFAELREAGFAPLAAELSAANARDARVAPAVAPPEPARPGLTGNDLSVAGAAARQELATATGAARLEPLLVLGVSEFAAGRLGEALGFLHEAQAIAPSDVRAYNLEARVRLASGDVSGARRAIEQGLAHVPGNPTLTRALRALESAGAAPR
jgi:spermidine synthase